MEVIKIFDIPKEVINDNERQRRVYSIEGISPSVLSRSDSAKIMEVIRLGNLYGEDRGTGFAGNVWDKSGVCPTITTMQGGGREPMIIEDAQAIRMVRTEEGKALRKEYESGAIHHGFNEHREMEPRTDGVSNTLTSVQKDNLVMETVWLSEKGKRYVCDPKRGMCTDINADVCQTLTAKGQSNWTGSFVSPDIDSLEKSTNIGSSEPTLIHLKDGRTITSNDSLAQYRIRKLTPKECWRLMDFADEDFEKAAEVNSATQLYKQAGNSIVRNVLVAIVGQMLPGKEEIYKGEQHEQID